MRFIYSRTYYYLVIVYVLVTAIVAVFSINFFGVVRSFTNKSNSMNPIIDTGSIIMVKKQTLYNPGDVISYYVQTGQNVEIVTHRILRMGGNVYVTKGDANQAIDREVVVPRLVIGKVILVIPYLGFYVSFAKGPLGLVLTIVIPAIIIISIELYKIIIIELKKSNETHQKTVV